MVALMRQPYDLATACVTGKDSYATQALAELAADHFARHYGTVSIWSYLCDRADHWHLTTSETR